MRLVRAILKTMEEDIYMPLSLNWQSSNRTLADAFSKSYFVNNGRRYLCL